MELSERRKIKELQDSTFSDGVKEIEEIRGRALAF